MTADQLNQTLDAKTGSVIKKLETCIDFTKGMGQQLPNQQELNVKASKIYFVKKILGVEKPPANPKREF